MTAMPESCQRAPRQRRFCGLTGYCQISPATLCNTKVVTCDKGRICPDCACAVLLLETALGRTYSLCRLMEGTILLVFAKEDRNFAPQTVQH